MTPLNYFLINVCLTMGLLLALMLQQLLRSDDNSPLISSRSTTEKGMLMDLEEVMMMELEKVRMKEPGKVRMKKLEKVRMMEPKKVKIMKPKKVKVKEPEKLKVKEPEKVKIMDQLEKVRMMELDKLRMRKLEKVRMRKPEERYIQDPPATYSFMPKLNRSCSGFRDLEPTGSPPEEVSSCNNLLPGLAHLEHGYNLFRSQSFSNRKYDKVFRFSCSDDTNMMKYDCNGSSCDIDASSCVYQKPEEVVDWACVPQESSTPSRRAFTDTNLLEHLVWDRAEDIENTLIYELEEDQLDVLKVAKVTEYIWIRREIQSFKLEGHIPTRSLIQEYTRLDPKMKSDQSYMDYYSLIRRFGTHVLVGQVTLGGRFLSVNLTSRSDEYVVKAEGGEPDALTSDEWSETLIQNPVPLPNSFSYITLSQFILRSFPGESSSAKMDNFEEILELEQMHQLIRNADIAMDILNINHKFHSFFRNAVKQELRYLCPSDEIIQVLHKVGEAGFLYCNNNPYWRLEEDGIIRYLMNTFRFNLIRGVCVSPLPDFGACTDSNLTFPPSANCIRFYKGTDCSGEPGKEIGTTFTPTEVENAMMEYQSFTPC